MEYRKSLAVSFMVKFGYYITSELALADGGGAALSLQLLAPQSVLDDIQRPPSYSCQSKEEASASEIVGASTLHASALKQVTGEAVYLDDMPRAANELYAVVVGSTEAHAHILSVDASEALAMDGVVDYISWKDIPDYDVVKMRPETTDPRHNPNMIGPVSRDEELFATKEVHHVNQVLGIIVAENEVIARAASRKVKVQYKKLPAIFTIEVNRKKRRE